MGRNGGFMRGVPGGAGDPLARAAREASLEPVTCRKCGKREFERIATDQIFFDRLSKAEAVECETRPGQGWRCLWCGELLVLQVRLKEIREQSSGEGGSIVTP